MLSPIITEWKGMRRQGQTFLKGALGRDETSETWKFHPDIGKIYFWFVFVLLVSFFLPQGWSVTEAGV